MRAQDNRGKGEDEDQPGDDEAHSADEASYRPTKAPRTKDGQLRRRRTGQEVGSRDAIFELFF